MSEETATMIEERNRKYLDGLQGNIGKYLSFLSTMARFHKYAVADLKSFAIEAPAMFTAVASAEFWEKHFPDMPRKRAERLVDALIGCFTSIQSFKNEKPLKNDSMGFYGGLLKIIAEELVNRSSIDKKSKKLLALSVESVILERMGMSTENATRQLARLSFKEHDIPALLSETQKTARIFLDAMQKSVNLQTAEKIEQTPELELKTK